MFLLCNPEQTVEQIFELLVIWDAKVLITAMSTFNKPKRGLDADITQ